MEHSTPELILYVREQLTAGFTRSTLESTLTQAGWSALAIEEAFRLLVEQHKTAPAQNPVVTAPVSVSAQLDQMLMGSTELTPITAPTSVSISDTLTTPQQAEPEILSEPFVDSPVSSIEDMKQPVSVSVTLPRDADPVPQIDYGIPDGTVDPIMATTSATVMTSHRHHWWQILILVILIMMTLVLLLLIFHALHVYEALSINTPLWADTILYKIQSLIPIKA